LPDKDAWHRQLFAFLRWWEGNGRQLRALEERWLLRRGKGGFDGARTPRRLDAQALLGSCQRSLTDGDTQTEEEQDS
jgi:hypothetical protein